MRISLPFALTQRVIALSVASVFAAGIGYETCGKDDVSQPAAAAAAPYDCLSQPDSGMIHQYMRDLFAARKQAGEMQRGDVIARYNSDVAIRRIALSPYGLQTKDGPECRVSVEYDERNAFGDIVLDAAGQPDTIIVNGGVMNPYEDFRPVDLNTRSFPRFAKGAYDATIGFVHDIRSPDEDAGPPNLRSMDGHGAKFRKLRKFE